MLKNLRLWRSDPIRLCRSGESDYHRFDRAQKNQVTSMVEEQIQRDNSKKDSGDNSNNQLVENVTLHELVSFLPPSGGLPNTSR